jgi:hypothetical protein
MLNYFNPLLKTETKKAERLNSAFSVYSFTEQFKTTKKRTQKQFLFNLVLSFVKVFFLGDNSHDSFNFFAYYLKRFSRPYKP